MVFVTLDTGGGDESSVGVEESDIQHGSIFIAFCSDVAACMPVLLGRFYVVSFYNLFLLEFLYYSTSPIGQF